MENPNFTNLRRVNDTNNLLIRSLEKPIKEEFYYNSIIIMKQLNI